MADAYCKGVNISLLTFFILAITRSTWHMRQLVRVKKCDSEERRDIYLGALQYVTNIWQLQTMVREHCRQCCSVHCSLGNKCIFLCTIVLFGIWWYLVQCWYCVDVWYLVMEQSHTSDKLRWWRAVYQLLMVLHHWCNLQYQLMCQLVPIPSKVWYCLMWWAVIVGEHSDVPTFLWLAFYLDWCYKVDMVL